MVHTKNQVMDDMMRIELYLENYSMYEHCTCTNILLIEDMLIPLIHVPLVLYHKSLDAGSKERQY